ncbi:MAG: carboxymuconolactone decarboxylase family protein [Planctomycetota bacterium]
MSHAKTFYENMPTQMKKVRAALGGTADAFGKLHHETLAEASISVREKELCALAVGLAVRCEPCIFAHVKASLDAGATPEQLIDVAKVVVLMQGGPGFMHVAAVIDALEALGHDVPQG